MDGVDVMAKDIQLIIPWKKVNATIREMNKLKQDVNVGVTSLTHEALARLKQDTPRGTGTGTHIADQWRSEFKTVGGLIREVRLMNEPQNELVLMCLEKGTKPHRIPTSGNKILHFMVGGSEVWAQNVMHKGSRAFEMVALTRQVMANRINALMTTVINRYAKKVTRAK